MCVYYVRTEAKAVLCAGEAAGPNFQMGFYSYSAACFRKSYDDAL